MDDGIYLKNGLGIGWTQLEGATIGSPALESFQGSLYAMVRGTDNGIYINRFGERAGLVGANSMGPRFPEESWFRMRDHYMQLSEGLIMQFT